MEKRRDEIRIRATISLCRMMMDLEWSKARLARVCGVSRNTVERWMDPTSRSTPDAAHLGAICAEAGEAAGRWIPRLIGLPWIDKD